mmetsp:Transcript_27468/g.38822  ORF Transcript_27468/g.38822 Transcript_27468/m.38822 type:complete len:305 (-) Transcript_27468:88-1002(-)
MKEEEARKKERELKKAAKNVDSEIASLFKSVGAVQKKVPDGVDPKTIICAHFKNGSCNRGNKCRYSHDLEVERKVSKMNIYSDPRETDTMDKWDQDKLETVVKQKMGGNQNNKTTIICKHFIEALETRKYGWFWQCPNGNKECMYVHKLPPGFKLKDPNEKKKEENTGPSIEEQIEEKRAELDKSNLTPVTLESFMAWKEKQKKIKAEAVEAKRLEDNDKKLGKGGVRGLSGRALFEFDPSLFVDDDAAAQDADYSESDKDDEELTPVKEESKDTSAVAATDVAAAVSDPSLFLDDEDLPSDED